MNHDSISPTAAGPSHHSPDFPTHGGESSSVEAEMSDFSDGITISPRARRHAHITKRVEFLDHLLRSLDIMIYCEMTIMYYMDCSFVRFLFRALIQFFLLTPKPPFVPPLPEPSPYIGAISGVNTVSLLFHMFSAAPSAGETTRGYLHGGLLIDFVGYKGPTSRWHLLALDLLVCGLQMVMLCVHTERQDLKPSPSMAIGMSRQDDSIADDATHQDLDAEERGFHRLEPHAIATRIRTANLSSTAEGIELQPLSPSRHARPSRRDASTGRTGAEEDDERDQLLSEELEADDSHAAHPLDVYHSGSALITEVHVLRTIRRHWRAYEDRPRTTSSTSSSTVGALAGSSAVVAANWAGRRFGVRVAAGQA
ncbi:MAG: hypothetical protein M1817_005023 [Caeruleum heppii]|nr:MAG: hypothetical protein M1817_005023 [Caeruleum heppii]